MDTEKNAAYYNGLIVTTIKVKPADAPAGSKVTFNEKDKNGSIAVFLKNIIKVNDTDKSGKREFEATVVSAEEAKEICEIGHGSGKCTPLFILHGFNVEPGQMFKLDYGIFGTTSTSDMSYYPVPVIWASEGNTLLYTKDQGNAFAAGLALQAFVDFIPNDMFPRKSLLLHSMGNHVVINGACLNEAPDVKFENIFMVAADVPCDIFNEKPKNRFFFTKQNKMTYGYKKVKAENFFQMLETNSDGKPKGKIYILWNSRDLALRASFFMNREHRLGKVGAGWVDGFFSNGRSMSVIRDKYRPYIENLNVTRKKISDKLFNHLYELESWAVEYYEEKLNLVVQE